MQMGQLRGIDVNELNIDNVNAGKTLFELFDLTGKEKYRKAIDLVYSQVAADAAYKRRKLLAQKYLSESGLAGRAVYVSAVLYGI